MLTLLFAICLISFLLMKNSPIDPIQAYIGADMLKVGPEQREKIAEYWGVDQPVMVQFLNWGSALLSGDLGTSMIFRRPVADIIGERFLNSLVLNGDCVDIIRYHWFCNGCCGSNEKGYLD